jgi:hypothetical protein
MPKYIVYFPDIFNMFCLGGKDLGGQNIKCCLGGKDLGGQNIKFCLSGKDLGGQNIKCCLGIR